MPLKGGERGSLLRGGGRARGSGCCRCRCSRADSSSIVSVRRLVGALAVVAVEVQEEGVDRDQDLSASVGHEGWSTGLGQRAG